MLRVELLQSYAHTTQASRATRPAQRDTTFSTVIVGELGAINAGGHDASLHMSICLGLAASAMA